MQDPIQRHPTRDEQLDILVSVLAATLPQGCRVLDLGCGTGYVDWMLLEKRSDLHLTGLDFKPDSLAEAAGALAPWQDKVTLAKADFMQAEPLAAASIGQVYKGELHDGRQVAVKVLRPRSLGIGPHTGPHRAPRS